MNLFIQIPCYNEEKTLPAVLADLPKSIPGIDKIVVAVLDDGSTDNTVPQALRGGAKVFPWEHEGLAGTFAKGLLVAIHQGADIIVNTDGDNQYCGADIEKLIQPILRGGAGLVLGTRPLTGKKPLHLFLQRFGSWVVSVTSGIDVPDAVTGFRAMSRDAAQSLQLKEKYCYTIEQLFQAADKEFGVACVPIRTNPDARPSRLKKSDFHYVCKQAWVILKCFVRYRL